MYIKVLAEHIYGGGLRRQYLRHHDHKLADFEILQVTKRGTVPKNVIKKGYFQNYMPQNPDIPGDFESFWINVRGGNKVLP